MNKKVLTIIVLSLLASVTTVSAKKIPFPKKKVMVKEVAESINEEDGEKMIDSMQYRIDLPLVADSSFLVVREPDEILNSLPYDYRYRQNYNPYNLPYIFVGQRPSKERRTQYRQQLNSDKRQAALRNMLSTDDGWLDVQYELHENAIDVQYAQMMQDPDLIEGAYWMLHKAPEKISPDSTFTIILEGHEGSGFRFTKPVFPEYERDKVHWLHVVNAGVQLSQAYLSPNWYQGGNNNLSLLINFLWDVQLNPAYHPNTMFQSTVSYKLGLNSNQKEAYHSYSISQDLFQWNMKLGFKAFRKKWFYTLTSQFKTQFLNNYEQNSDVRIASLLSSGDLNVGLGMTYSTANKNNTWKFNASIAPLSYNLKMCLDPKVNPGLFGIPAGKKYVNDFGSNAELTMEWKMAKNISYRSRMFLFTNYSYFVGDWENTFNFTLNRFLSTQLYIHLRYDSSSPNQKDWHHFMMKEILSFGFAYAFSTK